MKPWRAAAGAGVVAAAVRLFAVPRRDSIGGADAIVSLDGDRPRRVRKAVELAAAGVAPTLVIVRGEASAPELFAGRPLPFELLSFPPDPPTTRGEARAVARLARERGWRRIVVVTSTYHVTRARIIFRRAVGCEVVFAEAGLRWSRLPLYALLETAKLALALTARRSP